LKEEDDNAAGHGADINEDTGFAGAADTENTIVGSSAELTDSWGGAPVAAPAVEVGGWGQGGGGGGW
jgi:hypothetical protein